MLSWLPSQELLGGLRGLCVERDLFTISSGLMKILVDAESEEILGASMLGTGGDEVIHGILDMSSANWWRLNGHPDFHLTVSSWSPYRSSHRVGTFTDRVGVARGNPVEAGTAPQR